MTRPGVTVRSAERRPRDLVRLPEEQSACESGEWMPKRIIQSPDDITPTSGEDRWDLQAVAGVEISSEDPAHPVESAPVPGQDSGWRASGPGQQAIRLLFTPPHPLHRIWLEFVERTVERTQEFVPRWSPAGGQALHQVVGPAMERRIPVNVATR